VTGCYAQLRPEEIATIEGVDLVVGTAEKTSLFDHAGGFQPRSNTQIAVSCIDDLEEFGPAYSASERTRAFLKVQDGCDYSCAFCTIPAARGRSRSASIESTLDQAREIVSRGYREIVLSGINVGLFGQEHDESLLQLLHRIVEIDGIDRLRISSIEPNLLTDEIIDLVAATEVLMPHFHIPLQSGDDRVLGLMRRRYRRAVYESRIGRILDRMPDACIGSDVIVGFPGETNEAFENTTGFLADAPVAYLHVFTYSERPGTPVVESAQHGQTRIPKVERRRRNRVLRTLSNRKRTSFHARFVGKSRPVLWEGGRKGRHMFGFTDNYVKVRTDYDENRVGQIEDTLLGDQGKDGMLRAGRQMIMIEDLVQT
jgi:threonylcarbamoyladenosine tRNA methylthiotransferase MtaB